jgi:predicted AAA+ superfamily ATPase
MLKPWRELAVPHEDVLKGSFLQSEFAADLTRVKAGSATPEYQDPVLFFQRTFITEGMRLLLDSVIKRLLGKGGDPVIQLQTAFGGGKTHTMLAMYHLAGGNAAPSDLAGVSPILDAAGATELPKARIVVLDGNQLAPNQPKKHGKIEVRTMWGELAWQLGGAEAYERVRAADESGTSPGKDVLADLVAAYAPCVILVDELVRYVAQFEEGKSLAGGTFDSNLSFIQALTEGLKAVPNAIMLASLPESEREAGSQRGVKALAALSHYFGRVQALWKPVATEEAFEIVRRRLFTRVSDEAAAKAVCRAFADFYIENAADFPGETQEGRYFDRLMDSYPIHPEVFERLYEDWSTLDNFQRTRGVLKLMAKVIHRLWKDNNADLMIMPGSLPLYDADVRNEAIYYLPQGWDPVIEADVDGDRAETTEIESKEPLLGSIQACRRTARAIFLGSAPSTQGHAVRGIEQERIALGSAQPGQTPARFKDALKRLTDRLQYLNSGNSRYWFDTRPNLRREMEERKRRFSDKEDVYPAIQQRVERLLARQVFGGIHVFTPSGDIPDDWSLRLVVLSPDSGFSRSGQSTAVEKAGEILRSRGDQPRQKQNRLVFLAPDYDTVSRLKDQVRSMLAWQSIVSDYEQDRLNLDNYQKKQASQSLETARDTVGRVIRDAYKWVLAPMQEAKRGGGVSEIQWEHFQLNPGAQNIAADIERVLKENELLISEWAPIHLANLLKTWFWKPDVQEVGAMDVWQKSCCYLYLPRLLDSDVFTRTLAAGAASRDFFGFAYGKEDGKYVGFLYGKPTTPIMDGSLLLVEPSAATAFETSIQPPAQPPGGEGGGYTLTPPGPGQTPGVKKPTPGETPGTATAKPTRKHFYGSVDLDPITAKKQFADIVEEVVSQFTTKAGVNVRISIEIQAESGTGFDDSLQRVVKENSNVLKFRNAEFE